MKTSDKNKHPNSNQFQVPDEKDMQDSWENFEEFKKDYPQPNMKNVWEKVNEKIDDAPVKKLNKPNKWWRYAAAVIIPLAFAMGYYFYTSQPTQQVKYITQQAKKGARTLITLPDGSQVWLQAGATITYPEIFSTNNRTVSFSGMGYFKVTKNTENPFIVNASDITVHVLGTQFYIKNMVNHSFIETGLISGKVKLATPTQEMSLKPDDVLTYSLKQKKITKVSSLNTQSFKWDNGKIVFDNCELTTVLNELAEWYNVDLKVESEDLLTQKITLTIKEESLTEIMEIIKMVAPLNYNYHANELSVNAES